MLKFRLILVLFVVALGHTFAAPTIDSSLESLIKEEGAADIMIILKEHTSQVLQEIKSGKFSNSDEKTAAMVQKLKLFTSASQKGVMSTLHRDTDADMEDIQQFWVTNRISVKDAAWETVQALKNHPDIEEIREAVVAYLPEPPEEDEEEEESHVLVDQPWGIAKIRAPDVWADDFKGQNVVVATIATGARASHESIVGNRRAENYWHDPYNISVVVPSDVHGHGTHILATIVGKDVGVAPNATWITCRGCNFTVCTEDALIICGEWILNPNSTTPPAEKPNIVVFGWGIPTTNTEETDGFYKEVISSWGLAGIIPIAAVGDAGPLCGTLYYPGTLPNVISVSGTNRNDGMFYLSGRGQAVGTKRPDLSAPGTDTVSAGHMGDRLYISLSGTSSAAAHVAGAAALLLSKKPDATFAEIKTALEGNAVTVADPPLICTLTANEWPNRHFGSGILDANATIASLNV